MTILVEEDSFINYTGNGIQVFFEFSFSLDPDSSVLVFVNGVFDADGFQVQENGIRFFVAPVLGSSIIIARLTDLTQLRNWVQFDKFPP